VSTGLEIKTFSTGKEKRREFCKESNKGGGEVYINEF